MRPNTSIAATVLFSISSLGLADVDLQLSMSEARPGETIDLALSFENDGEAVGFQVDVLYDDSSVDVQLPVGEAALGMHVLDSEELESGLRRLLVYTEDSSLVGTGILARLPLTVLPGAAVGFSPVTVTASIVSDSQGDSVPVGTLESGGVNILPAGPDTDLDGIADSIEDQAPNNGDGNNDGILDSDQSNVTSLHDAVNFDFLTLVSPEGTVLAGVAALKADELAPPPVDVTFPFGLVQFTVENLDGAAGVDVELLLPTGVAVNSYYKYGPTPDDESDQWYDFLFDGSTGAEVIGSRIILHFLDGSRGDDDLAANGQISDSGGPAVASPTLYFAQFGDDDGLFSQIFLLNPDDSMPANAEITLKDDDGNPLAVDLNGEQVTGDTNVQIPALGMRVLETDARAPRAVGSVTIASDKPLAGVIVFGGSFGLAGVGNSEDAANGFIAPIEEDFTGIAVSNLEEEAVTLDLTLFDAEGLQLATSREEVSGMGHFSRFVDQFEWEPAVDFADFRGSLKATATGSTSATVIQSRGGEFATMPVRPLNPSAAPAADPETPQVPSGAPALDHSIHYAQFADGSGLFSQIILLNPEEDMQANARITLKDDDGNPLSVDLNGELVDGQADIVLPPLGLRVLETDGENPAAVGSVIVKSDKRLAGVILFGGGFGLAGVGASPELARGFFAPVEKITSQNVNTGIAVMNLENDPVSLNLTLLDADGNELATAQDMLPGMGHLASFVDQIEWSQNVDFSSFRGLIIVSPTGRVSGTVIQTRPFQFATMPVVPR